MFEPSLVDPGHTAVPLHNLHIVPVVWRWSEVNSRFSENVLFLPLKNWLINIRPVGVALPSADGQELGGSGGV